MCSPSKTRCSYTSSVTTSRSRSTASSAIAASSSRVSTVPVGLCGVLSRISRVRSVTASRSSSRSRRKAPSCGRRVTGHARAARHRDAGGVRVVVRLQGDDLVARLQQGEQRGGDGLGGARGDQHLGVGVVGPGRSSAAGASAIAVRSSGTPGPGGYWLPRPSRSARTAASRTSSGPSVSGKPWPRLIDPVRTASADISAKIVVPNSGEPAVEQRSGPGCVMAPSCAEALEFLNSALAGDARGIPLSRKSGDATPRGSRFGGTRRR